MVMASDNIGVFFMLFDSGLNCCSIPNRIVLSNKVYILHKSPNSLSKIKMPGIGTKDSPTRSFHTRTGHRGKHSRKEPVFELTSLRQLSPCSLILHIQMKSFPRRGRLFIKLFV
jgi:hypothetical protein